MEAQYLEQLMKEVLERRFPLYRPTHDIHASRIRETEGVERWYLGYTTSNGFLPFGSTRVDLNIDGPICYLLSIELDAEQRGVEMGRALYSAVEEFALLIGCEYVQLTPSGWTRTRRSRRDYMHELGYTDVGEEVRKNVRDLLE